MMVGKVNTYTTLLNYLYLMITAAVVLSFSQHLHHHHHQWRSIGKSIERNNVGVVYNK